VIIRILSDNFSHPPGFLCKNSDWGSTRGFGWATGRRASGAQTFSIRIAAAAMPVGLRATCRPTVGDKRLWWIIETARRPPSNSEWWITAQRRVAAAAAAMTTTRHHDVKAPVSCENYWARRVIECCYPTLFLSLSVSVSYFVCPWLPQNERWTLGKVWKMLYIVSKN